MRRIHAFWTILALAGPSDRAQPITAFVDVTVIPMDRERKLDHQTVIVEHGMIRAIGPAGSLPVPADAFRIDGRGKFLLPGLHDMHVHVDDTTDFLLYLAKGVTTVRNLEGEPYHLDWRRQIERGELLGPTIVTSGPFTNRPEIATPADARRAVIEQKAAGYDEIKIHGGLSAETYDTLIAVGRELGIRIVGHAPRNLPFEAVLRNRQNEISHAEELMYTWFHSDVSDSSVARIPELARLVKERGIWITPTFMTYDRIYRQVANLDSLLADPNIRYVTPYHQALWQRENNRYIRNWGPAGVPTLKARRNFLVPLIRGLHEAGVPLMTGTDAIGPLWIPGWSLHEELRDFVALGFTPYEALEASTRLPALYLERIDQVGTVTVGKRADLVLLANDPLIDIRNSESIAGVMVRGRWLARPELDQRLERLAQSNLHEKDLVTRILGSGLQAAAERQCARDSAPLLLDTQRLLNLRLTAVFAAMVRDSGVSRAAQVAARTRVTCPEAVLVREPTINEVGAVHRKAGRFAEAVEVLTFNAQQFPNSFLSHYWLAEALLEKGDTAQAIVSYRRSVELDPGMTEAIQRLKELAPAGPGQRRIEGNTIISDSLPSIRLAVDSSLGYLGRQTFVLYDVANADQFFFAELDGKRVKRFIWVQFEGYLPGINSSYDYSRDSTIAMWGKTLYRNSALRATPTTEPRPESDGARARAFLRERGLTLASNMLYHRMVWLLDQPARNELMIIYMEDPADYNPTGALDGALLRSLLNLSLRQAEQSISIRPR